MSRQGPPSKPRDLAPTESPSGSEETVAAHVPTWSWTHPETPAAPNAQLVGTALGHFRLDALLGRGGMGVVYRALDVHLQRTVALKVLRPEFSANAEWRRLFLGEARAAAAVSHRHVAAVYYVGVDAEQLYIAMELVEGQTLRSRLSAGLTVDEALGVAMQIARGMARAHDKGVLHRDLKPENVMVTPEGEVKILDFGLACRLLADADAPAERHIAGTVGYMSPEQAEGREVDARTDIFSFGVLLYELVTGKRPFAGGSMPVRSRIAEYVAATGREAPPPSHSAPVSPELEAVILRCLARRREDRYPDMRALLAALEGLRADRAPGGPAVAGRPAADSLAGGSGAPVRAPLPSGTVTLLVTGSADTTQLLEDLGDHYAGVVARRDELLRHAVHQRGGSVVEATSDGFLFVFVDARAALGAALGALRALATEPWPHEAARRVRMALHTGEPRRAGERYVGLDVHRAARITAAATAGQLFVSAATRAVLDDADLAGLEVRDLGPRRLADLRYPEHLFAVGPPGTAALASIQTTGALRHHLPPQPTTFVGRESQIAEVGRLIARADTRVVTLTGPGGTGKTRLSLEVARAVLAEFPGGVFQVQLAPVGDPALVMATIAQALDAPLSAGRPALDPVKARIGPDRMLLVLDNFEQVIDATPELAELLAGCPELKLLVTSRQPLKLRGEREHVVPPMQVPAGDGSALLDCESVRLFVDRVRDTRADFALTADNAPIVAAICARLEGLPLAIELAASRMKMLTLPALRDRLGDRLGFLKGGPRDAAARHQTLRAAIDWSHNLLEAPDKVLFRRAAVFVGGFAIESAEEVCGFPGAALDVFAGLASLTDKSLLTRGEVDGEPRLGMLETIREYAQGQLGGTDDAAVVRARHAAHFAGLAEAMAPGLMGRDQRRSVGWMLTEADNLRAALGWALEQPAADTTARLLRALLWLWIPQGQFHEGREWARRAVVQARGHGDPRPLAEVLDVAAWLGFLSGDLAGAVPLGAESVALFGALGDEASAARAQIALGASSLVTAPIPECERMLDEALAVCRRHGDRFGAAMALNALGELARVRDDGPRARACYAEAIALLGQCDNIFMSTLISANVVVYHMRDGDWRTAAALLGKMLELGQEFNYPTVVYLALAAMGGVAVARGRAIDGVRLIAAAERMLASIGLAPEPADRAEWDRHLAAARAEAGEAAVAAALVEGAAWTRQQALAATVPLRS